MQTYICISKEQLQSYKVHTYVRCIHNCNCFFSLVIFLIVSGNKIKELKYKCKRPVGTEHDGHASTMKYHVVPV